MSGLGFIVRAAIVALLFSLGTAQPAQAATGYASGNIKFYNALGNYCPTSRNCTGAKYTQAEFLSVRPARQAKVYVRDQNDVIVGQGVSSLGSGYYNIQWYSPSTPTKLRVTWHLEHSGGRFRLLKSNGTTYRLYTGDLTPILNGTTVFGNVVWGNFAAPYGPANQYDAAFRFWWDSAYWSSVLTTRFTGVKIYLNSSQCPTSCSSGSGKEIWMNEGADYSPQERIMHEMGHTASDLSHRDGDYWSMADYCYPSTGTCSWSQNSPEWKQSGLEEATASFFATVGLYGSNAVAPHTCLVSGAACSNGAYNVESGGSCVVGQDRWPLSALQTYWDLYDSQSDTGIYAADTINASYNAIVRTFGRFPNGRGSGQKNEGWGCFIIEEQGVCWPDNRDGRNMWDFSSHFQAETSLNPIVVVLNNCL